MAYPPSCCSPSAGGVNMGSTNTTTPHRAFALQRHAQEVIALPPSALQGIPERADELLAGLTPSINTVEDLASYKFYQIARAIVLLADMSGEGEAFDGGAGTKRPLNEEDTGFTGARANINKGLKRAFEGMSLREIADSDVSCLQGIAEDTTAAALADLHVKTVRQLGTWKYAAWAEALVTLAKLENTDGSSR